MKELIARLEQATGPDRELDFWCWWYGASTESRKANPQPPPEDYAAANIKAADSPRYTGSLDAAQTMVQQECAWEVGCEIDFTPVACVWGHNVHADEFAATPVLALCIAALKARQAIANSSR